VSWAKGDKSLADVLPPDSRVPILMAKAAKHRAKADGLIVDVVAEVADRQRQQAGEAARAARRARLADAGVLPKR
jgi:hypothetical protein